MRGQKGIAMETEKYSEFMEFGKNHALWAVTWEDNQERFLHCDILL